MALDAVAERAGEIGTVVEVSSGPFVAGTRSHTFHGRDIFAPVGAWLANGADFRDLGPAVTDVVRKPLPQPEKTVTGWRRFPGAARRVLSAFDRILHRIPLALERMDKLGSLFSYE